MFKCTQKKTKQQWDTEKPKLQAARLMTKHHDIFPGEFEELDAIFQEEAVHSSGTGNVMTRPDYQGTDAESEP